MLDVSIRLEVINVQVNGTVVKNVLLKIGRFLIDIQNNIIVLRTKDVYNQAA